MLVLSPSWNRANTNFFLETEVVIKWSVCKNMNREDENLRKKVKRT